MTTTVNIRDIQHYMYCPRRFALLAINRDWNENAFVVKANLLHEHVHDGSHSFSDKYKVVRSDITIYNDLPEYNIFGVTDCIEFHKNDNGVQIAGLNGKYAIRIVEYKPRSPKDKQFNEDDAIQVFAQKLCADFIWGSDCEAYLYYSDIRRCVKLPFDSEYAKYDSKIKALLEEMRQLCQNGEVPPRKRGQKCSGCSIKDMCFPKEKRYCIKDIVMSMKGEDI